MTNKNAPKLSGWGALVKQIIVATVYQYAVFFTSELNALFILALVALALHVGGAL